MFAIIPDTTYIRKPEQLGLMYKELDVNTSDNYKIATWFFPADTISESEFARLKGEKKDYLPAFDEPRPTVIICNGDAGNMSYFQLHIAAALTSIGFNVVTFDWRGFGESSFFEMDRNHLCYTEMLEDYRAVIAEVVKQPEVKTDAITVMGWSTGAYLSMITAYNNPNISAFVGRSLCTDFEDFIPLVMQVKNKTRDQLIIPDDFPQKQMPVKIASDFQKPIFLIIGENDLRTPVWMSKMIIDLLPKSTPRELMIVKNAAHGGTEDPIMIDFENFIYRLSHFLNTNSKTENH
jgi:Dipeptidyl aminopeptidases/acylaminoacyl-peptidases